jgi:hypothetical protein
VLNASDVVLVPLIPTVLSVRTFEQLSGFVGTGWSRTRHTRVLLHGRSPASPTATSWANLPTQQTQVSTIASAASIVEQRPSARTRDRIRARSPRRSPITSCGPKSPICSRSALQPLRDRAYVKPVGCLAAIAAISRRWTARSRPRRDTDLAFPFPTDMPARSALYPHQKPRWRGAPRQSRAAK